MTRQTTTHCVRREKCRSRPIHTKNFTTKLRHVNSLLQHRRKKQQQPQLICEAKFPWKLISTAADADANYLPSNLFRMRTANHSLEENEKFQRQQRRQGMKGAYAATQICTVSELQYLYMNV